MLHAEDPTVPSTIEELLALIPGATLIDGFVMPESIDDLYPTPYGDNPPAEWFMQPLPGISPSASSIVTADGRFCAFSHEWDRCHNGYTGQGECWVPPRSITGNRYFHQSAVVTEEGVQIPVGVIPLTGGHASLDQDLYAAMAHYDRPERVRVRARLVETDEGGIICGAIVPGTTYREVAMMRASALSGDWRYVPELDALDFLGPCFVARPGLPVGLEQAAIDQSYWEIVREISINSVAASGRALSVISTPSLWLPRNTVKNQLSSAVIAAAQGAIVMPSTSCSCQTAARASVTAEADDEEVMEAAEAAVDEGAEMTDEDMIKEAVRLVVAELAPAATEDTEDLVSDAVKMVLAQVEASAARSGTVTAAAQDLPIQNAAAIEALQNLVEQIANDVAGLFARELTPAEAATELPAIPDVE